MSANAVVRFVGPNGEMFTFVLDPRAYHANLPGMLPGWTFQVTGIPDAAPPVENRQSLVTPDEAMRNAQEAIQVADRSARANVDRSDRESAIMWTGIAEVWANIAEVRHMTTPLVAETNTQEPQCDTCQDRGCGECQVSGADDWPFNS